MTSHTKHLPQLQYASSQYNYCLGSRSNASSCHIILNLVYPCRTRTDSGTENPILAKCQMFLRRHHNDALQGPNSHYTVSSEINQVNIIQINIHVLGYLHVSVNIIKNSLTGGVNSKLS